MDILEFSQWTNLNNYSDLSNERKKFFIRSWLKLKVPINKKSWYWNLGERRKNKVSQENQYCGCLWVCLANAFLVWLKISRVSDIRNPLCGKNQKDSLLLAAVLCLALKKVTCFTASVKDQHNHLSLDFLFQESDRAGRHFLLSGFCCLRSILWLTDTVMRSKQALFLRNNL